MKELATLQDESHDAANRKLLINFVTEYLAVEPVWKPNVIICQLGCFSLDAAICDPTIFVIRLDVFLLIFHWWNQQKPLVFTFITEKSIYFFRSSAKLDISLFESLLQHFVELLRFSAKNNDESAASDGLAVTLTSSRSQHETNSKHFEITSSQILDR